MKKSFGELFDLRESKWGGFPTLIFVGMLLIVATIIYVPFGGKEAGYLTSNFLVVMTILAVIGIFFGEIGDRIPIWNEYIGGGTVLVFFVTAVLGTYEKVPGVVLKSVATFYDKNPANFLELFIPVLIVGSILTVNRKTLIQSIAGYIPLIIIGVLGATVGGVIVGKFFGKDVIEVIMNYMLPIMGGGTGAGAIPMSEMWAAKTGGDSKQWFAFAISILTIANVIAILTGAILKKIGEKYSNLTGNGELIINSKKSLEEENVKKYEAGQKEFSVALFLTGGIFMLSCIVAKIWSSLNLPFDIHRLAFLVIITMIINFANIIPENIKQGAKNMQTFFSKYTIWILMGAVGFGTDVIEIKNAMTVGNVAIAAGIVLGAVGAIMLVARKLKFYPIEAAITAGLCMANRGGSGDIAVLGAADRMGLISFAQISSRIGGAMMLILGSVIFGLFAK